MFPSRATIWTLRREGLIVPQPQKRLHSSLIRFEADPPNETWQTDVTHWHLQDGEHVEIMNMIDDHSRLFLASNNNIRPHRALDERTPLQAYNTRIKTRPATGALPTTHFRLRQDKVDQKADE